MFKNPLLAISRRVIREQTPSVSHGYLADGKCRTAVLYNSTQYTHQMTANVIHGTSREKVENSTKGVKNGQVGDVEAHMNQLSVLCR